MGANCCNTVSSCETTRLSKRYRKILWIALVVNLGMFGVEIIAGVRGPSCFRRFVVVVRRCHVVVVNAYRVCCS